MGLFLRFSCTPTPRLTSSALMDIGGRRVAHPSSMNDLGVKVWNDPVYFLRPPRPNVTADLLARELLRNVGDGRGQAASGCLLTASMPSMNFTPVISFGNWLWPSRRRQLFSAACASLKTMAIAVLFERHPLERTVRCRTVANVLSMGLVVRRCFQCSAGKS